MHPTGRHMVLLLVLSALVVAAAQTLLPIVELEPENKASTDWHLHMVNGLSNAILFVHCKSKNNDIGEHNLDLDAQIIWSFSPNVWGTTLFWCFVRKPGATASFDVFWTERRSSWLSDRCTNRLVCVWIAKDDGIYLRNIPANVDEMIHKWVAG